MHLRQSGRVQENRRRQVPNRPDADARTQQIVHETSILLCASCQWCPGVVGPETSLVDSEAVGPETKNTQVSLGFDMIGQLLSEAGYSPTGSESWKSDLLVQFK